MSNREDVTTESEVKEAPEETVNDQQDEEVEETIGDLDETLEDKKVPDNIPKARLDKEINRRKALEKELADLKAEKEADDSVDDPDKDPDVKELAKKLKQIEDKESQKSFDAKLTARIKEVIQDNPEFVGVADIDTLKQLAMVPSNKDLTVMKLLEKTYGNVISGKRTTETATPRGGAKEEKLDLKRAQTDPEYRREVVFKDPALKAEYNKGLENRINL